MESAATLNDWPLVQLSRAFTPTAASIPDQKALKRVHVETSQINLTPLNPVSFLIRAANIYPNKLAVAHPFTDSPVFYSYGQLAQRSVNLAHALQKISNIKPGDRVAVLAPNCPMILEAHFGVPAARAILNPINSRLSPQDISYVLEHSGSKLLLVDHSLLSQVQGLPLIKEGKCQLIISKDSGSSNDCAYERYLEEGRRLSGEEGWMKLTLESDENAPMALCYTSGTTGRPKGVVTTYRGSYLGSISNVIEGRLNTDGDSVYLWTLPMFHASGWTYPWAVTAAFGTHLLLRQIDYEHIWRAFSVYNVTHYCAAPTVQIGIVNHEKARRIVGRRINAIIAASAPTATLLESLENLGIDIAHVYGLTETYGPLTRGYSYPSWRELDAKGRSVQMSRQGQNYVTADEVRVVRVEKEEDGRVHAKLPLEDVPRDGITIGEIVMRGNLVMMEYYNNPEATKEAFAGGWFHSGDLAVRHPNGAIAIADRSKDIIISGGENVSSLEVESALSGHEDVLEAYAVARSDIRWGERPMAFKWKGREREFEELLKEYSKKVLAGYKRPHWIEVVDALPKTSTGKIQKFVLRGWAADRNRASVGGNKAKL
ncbi:hypothetical protein PROFUN_09976 [Planoprotostelium fungivorum]|uniref:AMP-dependent synthetase and ligase n=1 Tax=Planoprotostelium fungivorum TaxID=1890364 RepID=A0A2P6NFI6_9EUKA|nr:hypothetical protein PROFUN_09976 [Planoprotostelium fungivorum]